MSQPSAQRTPTIIIENFLPDFMITPDTRLPIKFAIAIIDAKILLKRNSSYLLTNERKRIFFLSSCLEK